MGKFYAVKIGLVPGVYNTWDECKAQVDHFSGAVYKSFATESEARDFINGFINGIPIESPKTTSGTSASKNNDHISIWVDGSYNSDTNEYGYGVYMVGSGIEKILCGKNECISEGRNVEGEVCAAKLALKEVVDLFPDLPSCIVYHDYEGVGKWADKIWKANKSYTRDYADLVKDLRDKGLKVTFTHVYGHKGIRENEYVDKLAKIGCNIPLTKGEKEMILELKDVDGFPNLLPASEQAPKISEEHEEQDREYEI